MQSGGSLRIGTELVDVATGSQLWGAQYDRKPGDIFVVQDEISNEISEKLRLQLTRAEKKRLTKRHTENAEAYRLYLKGRHHWNRWTEEGFYKAIEYFQQAVEKDPGYALAYTGLADSYVLLGWNSYLPPKEAFPKGKAAAIDSPAARPGSRRSPHLSWRPCCGFTIGSGKRLQTEFKRSLELSPTYPTANHWYAEYVMTMGRHEEAMARMKNRPGTRSVVAHYQRRSRMGLLLRPPIRRSHRTTPANCRIGPKLPGHVLDSRPVAQEDGPLRTGHCRGREGQ